MSPRSGRRPGESSSREDILSAARKLFAERGYDGASMRAIAAEAGVDAALVVHFFGNKPALLAEAVDWPFDPEVELPKLFAGGRRQVGRHLVELFVRTWDELGTRHPILIMLRAAPSEPQAAAILGDFIRNRLLEPLTTRLAVDQQELRAELVQSQLLGLALTRYVLAVEPLRSAPAEDVVRWVSPTVQRYLTGAKP
jgi:AcrR family transcriptional regulator